MNIDFQTEIKYEVGIQYANKQILTNIEAL